jgi:hypothetical protein
LLVFLGKPVGGRQESKTTAAASRLLLPSLDETGGVGWDQSARSILFRETKAFPSSTLSSGSIPLIPGPKQIEKSHGGSKKDESDQMGRQRQKMWSKRARFGSELLGSPFWIIDGWQAHFMHKFLNIISWNF